MGDFDFEYTDILFMLSTTSNVIQYRITIMNARPKCAGQDLTEIARVYH